MTPGARFLSDPAGYRRLDSPHPNFVFPRGSRVELLVLTGEPPEIIRQTTFRVTAPNRYFFQSLHLESLPITTGFSPAAEAGPRRSLGAMLRDIERPGQRVVSFNEARFVRFIVETVRHEAPSQADEAASFRRVSIPTHARARILEGELPLRPLKPKGLTTRAPFIQRALFHEEGQTFRVQVELWERVVSSRGKMGCYLLTIGLIALLLTGER